jgi:hypothetical protein
MEIHPPEHPIQTPRDFFLHLFTITVGLLIALALEGLVEFAHHKHIVHEARENIRRELESNEQQARRDAAYLSKNLVNVQSNVTTIHGLETHSVEAHHLSYVMEFSDFDQAAWHTARDTGALAYMPYDEVQQYSDIYNEQEAVNQKAQAVADREFLALAPMLTGDGVDKLEKAQYVAMLQNNGALLIEICTLREYVEQLDQQYQDALGLHQPALHDGCSNL